MVSETAITFSAPLSSTSASRLPWASNGSSGAEMVSPVSALSFSRTLAAKSRCVFRPVPVAVPPSGICATCGSAFSTRRRPSRICAA